MRALDVALYGRSIGTLFEAGERFGLAFNEAYIDDPQAPIISLAFMTSRGRPSSPKQTVLRLFPFFDNLLPEPNSRLRQFLAAQAGLNARDDMSLLRAFGGDLPGAVTLEGREWEMPERFREIRPPTTGMLRFSLAGVQMKFSVKKEGDVFELSPDGAGGTHILKLPEAGKPELPENEAAMMRFAAECGIETPSLQLVRREAVRGLPERFADFDGYAYVIQRFDRASDGRRVHVEDFAQILSVHPDDKYERTSFDNLMRICWNVMGDAALAEFVRRLVFSIAIANADMHLKNWSVRYANPRVPALAPAYDYVCTAAFAGYDDFLALPLAKTRHWEAVDVHAFLRAARNARVPPRIVQQAVEDTIVRIRDVWPRVRDATPESAKRIVERQLASRLFTAARS